MDTILFKSDPKSARRLLSRALTIIENDLSEAKKIIKKTFSAKRNTKIFGITGPPGVGKSSLINLLIESLIKDGLTIAVLAIDPSSPFSGGALLGDRTRMHLGGLSDQLYIRSSSSRGHLGGISSKTPEMISVLDAFGFDLIIIETVGVGQAELDIMRCAHMTSVVLSPNMGDALQALKAGIIEIADLFILNKADNPAVTELEKDILFSLSLSPKGAKNPKIEKTSCTDITGIESLKKTLFTEYNSLLTSGEIDKRVKIGLDFQLELCLRENLIKLLNKNKNLSHCKQSYQELMYKNKIPPREAALEIFKELEKTPQIKSE